MRILIVDDEPLARLKISEWLKHDADSHLILESQNGVEALKALQEAKIDVMFLDVQMPELSGFEVIERAPKPMPLIVFVTAFDRYAIDAFNLHAVDYLLKPYDELRFRAALERAKYHFRTNDHASDRLLSLIATLNTPKTYLQHFVVKLQKESLLVKTSDVMWIEADGNYVTLHAAMKSHLVRESISNLFQKLNPMEFVRVHRSTIVNLNYIKSFAPASHGDFYITLQNGAVLSLSRTYRAQVERVLKTSL